MIEFNKKELKELINVINNTFNSWNKEINLISLNYSDAYSISEIKIGKYFDFNKEKTIYYLKDKVVDDKSELEILHPSSCHDPCDFYREKGEEACKECEEKYKIECESWINKKPLTVILDEIELNISNVLVYEECYVNVKHLHTYKGYEILFETSKFERLLEIVEGILDVEEFLVSFKDTYIGKMNKSEFIKELAKHIEEYKDEVLILSKMLKVKNELLNYLRCNKKDIYLLLLRRY